MSGGARNTINKQGSDINNWNLIGDGNVRPEKHNTILCRNRYR